MNINSIGGCQALSQWSDYGASKFALRGLTQALRFEFEEQLPNLVMTNIYPYYINTGMFKGFQPLAEKLIPTIDQHTASNRIYNAIMYEESEVYMYWFLYYVDTLMRCLPLVVSQLLYKHLFAKGMKSFEGRKEQLAGLEAAKKTK